MPGDRLRAVSEIWSSAVPDNPRPLSKRCSREVRTPDVQHACVDPFGAVTPACFNGGLSAQGPWSSFASDGFPSPYVTDSYPFSSESDIWSSSKFSCASWSSFHSDYSTSFQGLPPSHSGSRWSGTSQHCLPNLLPRRTSGGGSRTESLRGSAASSTGRDQSLATSKATSNASEDAPLPADPTTVILRNIPDEFTSKSLVTLLDKSGFQGRFDYLYLPMGFVDGVNLGYAFVNLTTHKDALAFTDVFHGFSDWGVDSDKQGDISWARPCQGLRAHVERYRNSPVMHPCMPDGFKPMIFKDGRRVPFPSPTRPIKAPKVRVKPASQQVAGSKGAAVDISEVL